VSGRKTGLERGIDYHDRHAALVRTIRPRLIGRFRDLPEQDLLTAGLFLVARKP
jgi:hypothetical protein